MFGQCWKCLKQDNDDAERERALAELEEPGEACASSPYDEPPNPQRCPLAGLVQALSGARVLLWVVQSTCRWLVAGLARAPSQPRKSLRTA